ncbi:MAG TPA: hypothetical protein VFG95_09775 [Nitrospiria bacterium]|nr:hypothetical protein [Nitrospiria bacterium]
MEGHQKTEIERPPTGKAERCDICGAPVIEVHCKIVCTRCGYKRDCSDP